MYLARDAVEKAARIVQHVLDDPGSGRPANDKYIIAILRASPVPKLPKCHEKIRPLGCKPGEFVQKNDSFAVRRPPDGRGGENLVQSGKCLEPVLGDGRCRIAVFFQSLEKGAKLLLRGSFFHARGAKSERIPKGLLDKKGLPDPPSSINTYKLGLGRPLALLQLPPFRIPSNHPHKPSSKATYNILTKDRIPQNPNKSKI